MSTLTLTSRGALGDWLAERNASLRVVAALAYAVVTVSLSRLSVLLVALGLSLGFGLGIGLAWRLLARRVLALEGFMLVLVGFLPFTVPGETVATLAGLTISAEGLHRAAEILLTANTVMLAGLALLGTLDPVRLGYALGRLRVPDKLVHLFLFTVRYVGILQDEYGRLRRAMRARAFRPGNNRHSWRAFGWLFGMLLVRGLERSRRVHAAMKCRGFEGRLHLINPPVWQPADTTAAAGIGGVLLALLLLEHL